LATSNIAESGNVALLQLRTLPGTLGVFTAALSCVAGRKWANLKTLVVEPTVREQGSAMTRPLIAVTSAHEPFPSEWPILALARGTITGRDYADALADFTVRKQGKMLVPASDWLHHIIRPLFTEQITDQGTYDAEFDRAEVLCALLTRDEELVRRADQADHRRADWVPSWLGRCIYRARHTGQDNPLDEFAKQLAADNMQWGPLQGGLFGGDPKRAGAAIESLRPEFDHLRRSIF
jgi:hypothetical protein